MRSDADDHGLGWNHKVADTLSSAHRSSPSGPPRARQHGIALIEIFLAVVFMGMALLWHAASTVSGQQLMRAEASHGTALATVRAFLERLRADEEWATLYERLAALQEGPVAPMGHDPSLYYDDFEAPSTLGTAGVLVEVPRAAPAGGGPTDPLVLREDINAARFGLPYDLSGDGIVDDQAHDGDYRSLPIVVRFVWAAPGEPVQALTISTWLRGLQ